ncbi:hypothetical protein ES332_D11G395800v1 [Gossypium tomentosum]|uniref:Uncharacterized protein n=1 Tax=Gossypium tomentosum TaxID=34277 RepID=A0A5D2IXV9_GOSTO|nr:hypothetical protein ES332_D11G395800v1 [Gossypium tomentosum]
MGFLYNLYLFGNVFIIFFLFWLKKIRLMNIKCRAGEWKKIALKMIQYFIHSRQLTITFQPQTYKGYSYFDFILLLLLVEEKSIKVGNFDLRDGDDGEVEDIHSTRANLSPFLASSMELLASLGVRLNINAGCTISSIHRRQRNQVLNILLLILKKLKYIRLNSTHPTS